jgi:hypothetical protein
MVVNGKARFVKALDVQSVFRRLALRIRVSQNPKGLAPTRAESRAARWAGSANRHDVERALGRLESPLGARSEMTLCHEGQVVSERALGVG